MLGGRERKRWGRGGGRASEQKREREIVFATAVFKAMKLRQQ
jgi:hypothetical protein